MTYWPQFTEADCGVASLAMVLDEPYPLVRLVVDMVCPGAAKGENGMYIKHLEAVADALGVTTERRRTYDLDTDKGILSVRGDDWWHFVALWQGLVFDTDYTITKAQDYVQSLCVPNARFCTLLSIPQ